MERVAIPIWQGRISPVLDTAERLLICEVGEGEKMSPRTVEMPTDDIRNRLALMQRLGIRTVLCGAVSRTLHDLLVRAGMTVRPWLTGQAEDVLTAYASGEPDLDRFRLPGRGRRQRRGRSMHAHGQGKGRRKWELL